MDVEVRKASSEDFEDIRDLNLKLFEFEEDGFNPNYNLDWTMDEKSALYFRNSINEERACALVAVVDGKIVAYLIGWIWKHPDPARNFKKRAELENMFVLEEFRREGIGTKLVNRFLDWCKENEVDNIQVIPLSKNADAIGFYRKMGFKDYELILELNP